ncbi:helix-turn-helix domain-containing protein [Amycolatopsis thailandensis]|uniref:helix-turn-helix domain-containing protein n=1 Tax=Amycolatopsis thailandensis TaxID=589330 RepID=UPI00364D2007
MSDTRPAPAVLAGIDPTAWMSPREVGEIIGKSKWTVHTMCKNGVLGARRVGNRWKISGAHVIALLTGTDNQAAPATEAS